MERSITFDPRTLAWLELGEAQRLLFDQFPGLVLGFDLEGRIGWVGPMGAKALGYEPADLVGQPLIGSLLRREEIEARAAMLSTALRTRVPADMGVFSACLRRGQADEHMWVVRTKDGSPQTRNLSLGTLRDGQGQVTGLIAVERPVPAAVDAPVALSHHDSLTGLPTRAVLHDRAEMALQRAVRAKTHVGFLLIELDGFDELCARHGASVGDDLLRATAGRLHFELRKTDTAVRLGGGQFVAMLVDLRQADEAERVAAKICHALGGPVNTGVEMLHPRCHIGVAVSPDHGDQLLPLLEAAEQAMRSVRQQGSSRVGVAPER
ncbi:MAG: diguanylate cyclase [Vitreoscilla sp.]|nr:diguanylate cyclase [Vitreoscilla sp.]